MPSLRQEAAAFSPLDSISVATCSAFSNAACRLSMANTAFQGGRGPCRVLVADPGQDVAHEVDHAPLVSRVRQHRVHGGHQPGAPVADHEPHAPETAFDHAPDELPPAGPVLLHALRDADDLTAAGVVHADGDQHAHVLDRPAPRAPVAARRPRTGTGTNAPTACCAIRRSARTPS